MLALVAADAVDVVVTELQVGGRPAADLVDAGIGTVRCVFVAIREEPDPRLAALGPTVTGETDLDRLADVVRASVR